MGTDVPQQEYLFVEAEFDHWSNTEDLFGDPVFEDWSFLLRMLGSRILSDPIMG